MNRPDQIFDAILVIEYQAGKKRALDLLVRRWHSKFCKHAYWYTRDKEHAKDVVQDSWGVILNKMQFLRDPNRFGSWAMRIVTNKAVDWLRKQKKEPNKLKSDYDLPDSTTPDNTVVAHQSIVQLVQVSIKKLPQKQQVVLRLFYMEEFTIKQISDVLNISAGTIKSRLFTARESLKTILKNRNYEN